MRTLLLLFLFPFCSLAENITFLWDKSPDTNVIGYNVYFWHMTVPGAIVATNVVTVGNVTNATATNLVIGQTYSAEATAYNSSGLESDRSNRLTFTVPAKPLKLVGFKLFESTDMERWKQFFKMEVYVP